MEEAKSDPSEQELFDRIYSGAKEENLPTLLSALEHTTLLIRVGMHTPLSKLLSEGTSEAKKAIQFLFKNFPKERMTLFDVAIVELAASGDNDEVNAILDQAFDPVEKWELTESAAFGYLKSGRTEEYKALDLHLQLDLWKQFKAYGLQGKKVSELTFPTDPKEKSEALSGLLAGYVGMGCDHLVKDFKDFIDTMELNIQEKANLYGEIAYRYIVCGYPEKAQELVQTHPLEEQFDLLEFCMYACAFINDSMSIQNILRHAVTDENRADLKIQMLDGHASGGHLRQLNHLLTEGGTLGNQVHNYILRFAEDGNENEVKKRFLQIQNSLTNREYKNVCANIINTYIDNGYLIFAVKFLEIVNRRNLMFFLVDSIRKQLTKKGLLHEDHSALFILALFNLNYQPLMAKRMKKHYLISRAAALHPLLTTPSHLTLTRPMNYRFLIGKNWPQTLEFVLMTGAYLTIKYGLPQDAFLHIASLLSGLRTTQAVFEYSNRLFKCFRPTLFDHYLVKKDSLLTIDLRVDEIPHAAKKAKLG